MADRMDTTVGNKYALSELMALSLLIGKEKNK